jgi:hypothetical protein
MMLAPSRSLLDRRVLAAFELVDAATQERITAPMIFSSTQLGCVRNRSGLYVINALNPQTAQERTLASRLKIFEERPDGLATGSISFPVTITDPTGRYLPRIFKVSLPRGTSANQAISVPLFPAPIARIGQNWSGIRASLKRRVSGREIPLAGARVSLLRSNDNQLLGQGMSDSRGEVLAIAVGIPIIDFTTAPPLPSPPPSSPPPSPAPLAPLGTKKTAAKIIIETSPGQPWPTDPDIITTNGQNWVPMSGNLPTIELETGRVLSDGLAFLLKTQP